MKNDELLHKWYNNTLSAEELILFEQRPEYESLARLKEHTESLEVEAIATKPILDNILKKDKVQPNSPSVLRSLSSWVPYAVAASLLLFAVSIFWLDNSELVQVLATNVVLNEKLPDGSLVQLKTGSSISYNKSTWIKHRKVDLIGEANFKVEPGQRFEVTTTKGKVEVLGTEFIVNTLKDYLSVQCLSGKVGVSGMNDRSVAILEANESTKVFENGKVLTDKTAGVKLRQASLTDLVQILTKTFKIQVVVEKEEEAAKLNTSFGKDDLEEALKVTLTPLNIRYEIKSDTVFLKK